MPGYAPHITQRSALKHAALATAGLSLAPLATACTTSEAKPPPTSRALTIGYIPIACATPLILADANGLFEQQGIEVSLKKFAGWADLWSAYATGELDIAHMLSPMPIAINAGTTNGHRPTELLFTQNTNGQAITLASRHIGEVKETQDFRGKVIGIPFEYSVHALLLRDYLAAHGVDTRADVELRLLRPADMVAQLQVGGIDGFVGPEPFNQRALASGAGRIFKLTKQLWPGHPCCSIAAAKQWRAANESTAKTLHRCLEQASEFANNPLNRRAVAKILAREQYLNQSAELFLPTLSGEYENWHGDPVMDHERMVFGSPTDPAAITWMAAQIARWDLGGTALTRDDATLIRLADSVLPPTQPSNVSSPGGTVTINGREFDPNLPTSSF